MKLRFKNLDALFEYVLLFGTILVLWTPNSYSYILPQGFYGLFRWFQYLVAICPAALVIVKKKVNLMYVLNCVFCIILMFSTVIYHGHIHKCLNYVAPLIGTVSLIVLCIGSGREKELLLVFRYVLTAYILINIATYFLFPNGLYTTPKVIRLDDKPNTFLGNRNAYKFYGLMLILFSYLEESLKKKQKRVNYNMIAALGLSLLMEVLGESLTGSIIITAIALYYFFGDRIKTIRKIDPRILYFAASGIVAFSLIFLAVGQYTGLLAMAFGENITFSHRTFIWVAAEEVIMKHPVLGIGSQATDVTFVFLQNVNCHDQYLEVALRGGFVALGMFMFIVWTGMNKLSEYKKSPIVPFFAVCIFAAMVIDMVECETYSYAFLSYFTAMAYSWRYSSLYAEKRVGRKKKLVLRLT